MFFSLECNRRMFSYRCENDEYISLSNENIGICKFYLFDISYKEITLLLKTWYIDIYIYMYIIHYTIHKYISFRKCVESLRNLECYRWGRRFLISNNNNLRGLYFSVGIPWDKEKGKREKKRRISENGVRTRSWELRKRWQEIWILKLIYSIHPCKNLLFRRW